MKTSGGNPVFPVLALAVACMPMAAHGDPAVAASWSFEDAPGVADGVQGSNRRSEAGVRGMALKLDGFSTRVEHAAPLPEFEHGFSVEAWVALQEYPWNWTAVADCSAGPPAGFFLGFDDQGTPGMKVAVDGKWVECMDLAKESHSTVPPAGAGREPQEAAPSARPQPDLPGHAVPLHTWNHLVGTYDPGKGIAVYLNGTRVGFTPATGAVTMTGARSLRLGASHERLAPVHTERGPSMRGSMMLLSGLLDEVVIHHGPLGDEAVAGAFRRTVPRVARPLEFALMPTGPLGRGVFGASMEDLRFSEGWDGNYRLEGPGDVVVKFDEFPYNYVFWRGWNYGPCLVTENGLLMSDQSVERSNEHGCTEHMSDKQNRYSRIRIVENHDARVVLCWRYNPCDIFYGETNRDPASGWADWAEEYFHIYPDGVMMREQRFYTTGEVERRRVGGFGGWPSNQETIFFNQPGKGPLDTVDVAALTVANDAGESRTFSWQPEFPGAVGREPATPTIQMVNFKSRFRPYMLRRPGATIAAFPPSGFIDRNFPYWNHWPVAQLANDGRKGTRTDRPAHTSLAWFCEPPVRAEGNMFTWNYLYGLTDQPVERLAGLSRSWNSPPPMNMSGTGYHAKGYDNCERAYLLESATPGEPVEVSLWFPANEASPYMSPALIVKKWNGDKPAVSLNGRPLAEGRDCRIGIHHELEGSKLIVWIRHESTGPVSITLTPTPPPLPGHHTPR